MTGGTQGTACRPFVGPDMPERFANPHAWTFALRRVERVPVGPWRGGHGVRARRADIAARRADVRETMRAGRDVGAPHTWPVFGGGA